MLRKALGTIIGGALALGLLGFVPQARAQEARQITEFTFSQTVRLPNNVLLPAGAYWFRVPDPMTASNVVQVLNAKQTRVLATLDTIPTDRRGNITLSPTVGDSQLTLATLPNQPPLLISWIYAGNIQGHEFLYSARRENQLAERGQIRTMNIPNGGRATVG